MSISRSVRGSGHGSAPRESAAAGSAKAAARPSSIGDLGYIFALITLISFGMIMIYSTNAAHGPKEAMVKVGTSVGVGLIGVLAGYFLPLKVWRRLTLFLLVACFVALASLLIPHNPLAVTVLGGTRWIKLGPLQAQPSEFAKLAFVLFSAQFLERWGRKMKQEQWAVFLGVFLAFALLIYKEPDLGTTLVLCGTAFSMLLVGGIGGKKLLIGVLLGAMAIFVLAWSTPHQRVRFTHWLNPWGDPLGKGMQTIQSWTAIARGGMFGVGLGQSTQKLDNRLPEAETDFIFAIVAEELGLIRSLFLLGLFGLLAWRGYAIAARAPDRYSSLLVVGVTSWIAVQACLNVAVVTGTLPNTGVPLPFISSGGSSFVALMAANGLVLGVSRRMQPEKARQRAA